MVIFQAPVSSALSFSSRSAIQIPGWCCVWHQYWTDLGTCLWERRNYKLWTPLHGPQFGHTGKNFTTKFQMSVPLEKKKHTQSITLLSITRWRNHFHLHLPMLWKVSAQTQSTTSPWQPSPIKALAPSPMTYHRRPCKPVCSPSCSLCVLANKGVFPNEAVNCSYVFTKVNWGCVLFPFN